VTLNGTPVARPDGGVSPPSLEGKA
jgi:hypothetical protein